MDSDLASLPDDLLDVRQDLSQYSYDPGDLLDLGDDQAVQDSQLFVSSQQSSQASYKLGDSLPFGDARFVEDEDADMFDDFTDPSTTIVNECSVAVDRSNDVPKTFTDAVATDNETCLTDANVESDVAVPPVFEFFGNNTAFDVKTEPSEVSSPSASVLSYSTDSTSKLFVLSEEASHSRSSISDSDLLTLPTRELNRRIRQLSLDEQRKLKNRRRTLKNRGYAQTCRTRRVGQRNELEAENERLAAEIEQLTVDKTMLIAECDRLRSDKVEVESDLVRGEVEGLRASNEVLRLRQELDRTTAERDFYKGRLELLLNFFSINGILYEEPR